MPRPTLYRHTFARLIGFLRPFKVSFAIGTLFAIGGQVAQISIGLLSKPIIDTIEDLSENGGSHRYLWELIGLVVVLGIVRSGLMYGRRMIAGRQALAVEAVLRNLVYARLVRLSFSFYDRHQTGQLMSRATVDVTTVRMFLGYGLLFMTQHLFTVIGVTAAAFLIAPPLAAIALAIIPILGVVAYRYSHVSHPVLREVQQRMADVATAAEENIVGVHVVKAFAQEGSERTKFAELSERVFRQSLRANRQRAIYQPLMSLLPMFAAAGVLFVGGRMVINGDLTMGDFVAFNLLLLMLLTPLRTLGMWIGQAQRATASGERIFELIDEVEDVAESAEAVELPAGRGHVVFKNVTFAYEPERPVLTDIDLELEPGRTVALIGHTGSGKTTLAALIPRFYDIQDGSVRVDGADVRDLRLASLRGTVGVVSQDPFLFSATVRENIAFGKPGASEDEIRAAAESAQAAEFISRLPEGYDTVIGERGITLSGGQRQRVAIARALLLDPRILILDDATASVDATTESRIRAGLTQAMQGRTTIIIAHRLSTIALADEVVVLDQGRIVARGTQAELLETSPVYREMHEHGLLEREFTDRLEARA